MRFETRNLEDSEVSEFNSLAETCGSVFSMNWFLNWQPNIVRIGVFNGQEMIGGLALRNTTRHGIPILTDPIFAPNCNAFISFRSSNQFSKLAREKAFMEAIASHLSQSKHSVMHLNFPPKFSDAQPFIWRFFNVRPSYTYRLNIGELSMQEIESCNFASPDIRRKMRRALEQNIEVSEVLNKTNVLIPIKASLTRAKLNISDEVLDDLADNVLLNKELAAIYVAKNANEIIASALIIYGPECAYLILGGQLEKGSIGYVSTILYAMKEAKLRGCRFFDFEGSMNISIEYFFRQFGASLTPYLSVVKAPYFLDSIIRRNQVKSFRK